MTQVETAHVASVTFVQEYITVYSKSGSLYFNSEFQMKRDSSGLFLHRVSRDNLAPSPSYSSLLRNGFPASSSSLDLASIADSIDCYDNSSFAAPEINERVEKFLSEGEILKRAEGGHN